ncbi:MAG: hypothetical protein D6722_04215 [Bacteroidetes bacterium]|nr:MAG: hypothetical protein D6722_04215 [Bacteroidota bacterium]
MRLPLYLFLLLLGLLPLGLTAQVEMVYDEQEQVQEVNPINAEGQIEGVGVSFHPNGGVAREITYEKGIPHGDATSYYQDGSVEASWSYYQGSKDGLYTSFYPGGRIRMLQDWYRGERHGETYLFYPTGELQAYVLMNADTTVFAQRFDAEGRLVFERLSVIPFDLDTVRLPAPVYFLAGEGPLRAGETRELAVFIPEVPTAFVEVSCRDAELASQADSRYPYRLTPAAGATRCTLYLRVRLREDAQPALLRRVEIPVQGGEAED